MKKKIIIGFAGATAALVTMALVNKALYKNNEPKTAIYVDLQKYLGKWYDIAHYPAPFQKGCSNSTAEYKLRADAKIEVHNSCFRKGKLTDAKGKAWIVDKKTNAKLKVQFFWPFAGDYWILDLADDYRWALVGHPARKYMWILSRTPKLTEADKNYILERVKFHGYDVDKMVWEPQNN